MTVYYQEPHATLYQGDSLEVLKELPSDSVDMCVTSPPYYGLREYGMDGQIGIESTPEEYVSKLVAIFKEVRRVLKNSATLWLNLGDSYAGSWGDYVAPSSTKHEGQSDNRWRRPGYEDADYHSRPPTSNLNGLKKKDLIGIPWRVAFALQADGWWLRQDIIWSKPNPMPESVKDRCTKSHEYIFLLSKSAKYYYDQQAIKEPIAESTMNDSRLMDPLYQTDRPERGFPGGASHGAGLLKPDMNGKCNKRSVWVIPTKPYKAAHFATYPPDLVKPCILAGCPKNGVALDPFAGSGTTLAVAKSLGRKSIGIELNPDYCKLCVERLQEIPIPMELGVYG